MARNDPYLNSRFLIEIEGITQAGFSECTGFDVTTDPVDYREGNEPPFLRKLPGLTKFGTLSLKWGITDSPELWDWRQKVIEGKMSDARKNGSIIIQDEEGNEKLRWNFRDGWPSKYDPSDLNAKSPDVAIETLEITFEELTRA